MRFLLVLVVLTILASGAACGNKDVKISDNEVKVDAAGIRVTVGSTEADQLKAKNDVLVQQVAMLQSQLADKEKLSTDQLKKLQQQTASVLEQVQALTKQVGSLQQNNINLQDDIEQLENELTEERAAREAADRRARVAEAERARARNTIWHVSAIENRTRCRIDFSVFSETGTWQNKAIHPGERITYRRQGERVVVKWGAQQRSLKSIQIIGYEPTYPNPSDVPINYFGTDYNGYTTLYSDR